ncbi:phosphotransferase family protein [Aspergillus heteromorphus CBS 117.55]|uniref:Altered inheritance of mitochondria protein 9, mitochondrial n=1 Tax=Aspergillus heteromorphus CBS 117.55 TaxID=1448321 RepID=A0A317WUT6_9EURO|nr:phosphotransferase family protein [Aspergillus heteromorphus CBS 117.55]PWY89845.1 phosphotransferase family protein [Aspergillus heteromorphus CBS 117.55]
MEQHYVKFNIDNLCRQAASLFGNSKKCAHIMKMEGNFNKAFLITMDDGKEVVAKIPCPNAGATSLTTESEVATLKFLRSYTSIQVPEVFAWNSDPTNPVGAEYILMERIRGIALSERWDAMNTLDRYKIIDQIIKMEKELEGLKFPAYGSLYMRASTVHRTNRYLLPSDLDPEGLFYIGPLCSRAKWNGGLSTTKRNNGPWTSFPEFALSVPERESELVACSKNEVQNRLNRFDERQSVEEYSELLEKAEDVLPIISRDPRVVEGADPVIWHTDLHLGNIFVSPDSPTTVEGIIDWQSSQVAPLFLQARFPEFLRPPKSYVSGTEVPGLSAVSDEPNAEQKEQAAKEKKLVSQSKYYEMSCLAYNKRVYNAMGLDQRLWEPFTLCHPFSNGSIVPLRNSLIRISEDWALLGLPGSCPFEFNEEEIKMHSEQLVLHQDMLYLWDIVTTQLCTDNTGWVPVNRWEETRKMNKHLFDMYMNTMNKELSSDEALKKWPFPPEST